MLLQKKVSSKQTLGQVRLDRQCLTLMQVFSMLTSGNLSSSDATLTCVHKSVANLTRQLLCLGSQQASVHQSPQPIPMATQESQQQPAESQQYSQADWDAYWQYYGKIGALTADACSCRIGC